MPDIGIDTGFASVSRVHHRATAGVSSRLRIAPEHAGSIGANFWLPALTALRKLLLGDFRIDGPLLGVNRDDVAIVK